MTATIRRESIAAKPINAIHWDFAFFDSLHWFRVFDVTYCWTNKIWCQESSVGNSFSYTDAASARTVSNRRCTVKNNYLLGNFQELFSILINESICVQPILRYTLLAASSENFTGSLQLKSFDWFSSDGPLVTSENDILWLENQSKCLGIYWYSQ